MNRLGAEQQLHSQANTTNYVELIMSKLDCTARGVKKVVDEAEQLSLLILMLFDQSLDEEFLRSQTYPLLQKLNDDLSQVSSMILLQNQAQGGMGEAPMLDALEPSSC